MGVRSEDDLLKHRKKVVHHKVQDGDDRPGVADQRHPPEVVVFMRAGARESRRDCVAGFGEQHEGAFRSHRAMRPGNGAR
jgi:hypothetical protein